MCFDMSTAATANPRPTPDNDHPLALHAFFRLRLLDVLGLCHEGHSSFRALRSRVDPFSDLGLVGRTIGPLFAKMDGGYRTS